MECKDLVNNEHLIEVFVRLIDIAIKNLLQLI